MSRPLAPVRPALRLLRGGPARLQRPGLEIAAAPDRRPPFPVEAVAYEEDTFLVLSAPARLRPPAEHPVRIFTALWEAEPRRPGTVLVERGRGRGLRLLAVVHDLNAEPSWREEWVEEALAGVFAESARRGLRALGLQLLGCRHGRLPPQRFAALLGRVLRRRQESALAQLWLIAHGEGEGALLAGLARALGP